MRTVQQSAQTPEGLKPSNMIPDAAKTQKSKHVPFSALHWKSSLPPETRGHHTCVLQVVLGDDRVSEHAVLLHRQVVGAAGSALVGAGHDSEPASLPLHKVGQGFIIIINYYYDCYYYNFLNTFSFSSFRVQQKPGPVLFCNQNFCFH